MPTFRNTLCHLFRWCSSCLHHLWICNRWRVPKRRHLKLRLREITQKKEYNQKTFLYMTHKWSYIKTASGLPCGGDGGFVCGITYDTNSILNFENRWIWQQRSASLIHSITQIFIYRETATSVLLDYIHWLINNAKPKHCVSDTVTVAIIKLIGLKY